MSVLQGIPIGLSCGVGSSKATGANSTPIGSGWIGAQAEGGHEEVQAGMRRDPRGRRRQPKGKFQRELQIKELQLFPTTPSSSHYQKPSIYLTGQVAGQHRWDNTGKNNLSAGGNLASMWAPALVKGECSKNKAFSSIPPNFESNSEGERHFDSLKDCNLFILQRDKDKNKSGVNLELATHRPGCKAKLSFGKRCPCKTNSQLQPPFFNSFTDLCKHINGNKRGAMQAISKPTLCGRSSQMLPISTHPSFHLPHPQPISQMPTMMNGDQNINDQPPQTNPSFGFDNHQGPSAPSLTPSFVGNMQTPLPFGSAEQLSHTPTYEGSHSYPHQHQLYPPVIHYETLDTEPYNRYWENGLVGHFIGPPMVMGEIEPALERLWGCVPRVRYLADDILNIDFEDGDIINHVLEGSPWPMGGRLLIVKPWEECIQPSLFEITEVPTWVNIVDLPVDFWPYPLLSKFLRPIGTLIKINRAQATRTELRWLRVLVMVSLFGPRINEMRVEIGNKIMKVGVLYDGNPKICIQCGDFDHYHGNCEDDPGTGRAWSRFDQANLPFHITTTPASQQQQSEEQHQQQQQQNQQQQQSQHQQQGQDHDQVTTAAVGAGDAMIDEQTARTNEVEHLNQPPRQEEREGHGGGLQQPLMIVATGATVPMQQDVFNQLWSNDQTGDAMEIRVDLGMPIHTPINMLSSPSLYSTASDSSLHANANMKHAWRMYVPDIGYGLDDLDLEDMMVDQNGPNAIIARTDINSTEAMLKDQTMNADLDVGVETSPLQNTATDVVFNQQGLQGIQTGLEREMNQGPLAQSGGQRQQSKYKSDALQQLCILHEDKDGERLQANKARIESNVTNNEDNNGNVKRYEAGMTSKGPSEAVQTTLKTQIDRVIERVEEAMSEMRESETNKRVKRTIQTSAAEVKNMAMQLGEQDSVEGMLMKDDSVVVFVSSENSGESGDRKRKRRGKTTMQGGTVASRLRKKGPMGIKVGALATGSSSPAKKRRARMAVRKIKASAIKPSTSLTLAPPTLGLPTP